MKIALACDHSGLTLKTAIKAHLLQRGFEPVDFGTDSTESCDYPDFVIPAARAVADGSCERGILVCTTGIGVAITANKIHGIRCAQLADTLSARLTRQHNNTNMMSLGQGVIGEKLALELVDIWLDTAFEGGRHQRRNDKVMALDNE